jgi:hypothetical protein
MSKLIDIDRLFNGRHFYREVIVLCVCVGICVTSSAFETSLK